MVGVVAKDKEADAGGVLRAQGRAHDGGTHAIPSVQDSCAVKQAERGAQRAPDNRHHLRLYVARPAATLLKRDCNHVRARG